MQQYWWVRLVFDSTSKWVQCITHSPVYYIGRLFLVFPLAIAHLYFTLQIYVLIYFLNNLINSGIWVHSEVDKIAFVAGDCLFFQLILTAVN